MGAREKSCGGKKMRLGMFIRKTAVLLIALMLLFGCAWAGSTPNEADTLISLNAPETEESALEGTELSPNSVGTNVEADSANAGRYDEVFARNENVGVTSANVRLYFVEEESISQRYYAYRMFDLSQVEHYREFIHREDDLRIIFITEYVVRDFRFLSIMWNDNFSREDANEGERRYSVRSILYSLDELTPEIPLVVRGADFGCALAANGFSFTDENDTVRYFSFLICGKSGFVIISEF